MEVAAGAGIAVAARLHIPEQGLAEDDGGVPVADETREPGNRGHRDHLERAHRRQAIGAELAHRAVAANAATAAGPQRDDQAADAVSNRASRGCKAIDHIGRQPRGDLILLHQVHVAQRAGSAAAQPPAAIAAAATEQHG